MTVGGLMRDRRKLRGWSQEFVADKLGMKQTYLSRLERDEVGLPQRATLEKIGALLGITLPEFYRAAGVLEGLEESPTPLPVETDRPFSPTQIVAYVESKPDATFQAQLGREKSRRTPESYARLCQRIYRAWTSNADLVMGELEHIGQE